MTAFLARAQNKPLHASEMCMRAVLRYVRAHPCVVQQFPPENAPDTMQQSNERRLVCYGDASWGETSVTGEIVTWCGHMIKAFSRKQTVPALSSCEAELIAAVDLAKEALSAGMLVQTILDGVSCSPLGEPLVQVTNFSLTFYLDSESGIDAAHMSGLLRRVRHLQLRIAFLQHLVKQYNVDLQHISGLLNPSDALTKTPDMANMRHLKDATGLREVLFVQKGEVSVEEGESEKKAAPNPRHVRFDCETEGWKLESGSAVGSIGGARKVEAGEVREVQAEDQVQPVGRQHRGLSYSGYRGNDF